MTLKTRRIIAFAFIGVFCLAAPLLMLYSFGYRMNFQTFKFQKTGSVLVVSQPRGATIYLNGQKLFSATPAHINQLLPGEYSLRLEKQGYEPWSRTILVQSGQSTFAEELVLFSTAEPQKLTEQKILWIDFSPRSNFALFAIEDNDLPILYLLDLANARTTLLQTNLPAQAGEIFKTAPKTLWSSNGAKCIAIADDKYFLISTVIVNSIQDFTGLMDENKFETLKWASDADSYFFGQIENRIFKIDTFLERTLTANEVFAHPTLKKIPDFLASSEELLILIPEKQKTVLERYGLPQSETSAIVPAVTIDNCENARFSEAFAQTQLIQCVKNSSFYFIETNNSLRMLETELSGAMVHPSGKRIILFSDDKILAIEPTANGWMKQSLEKTASKGMVYRWHNSPEYFLTLDAGKLNAVETDTGFTTALIDEGVTAFSANSAADRLYFVRDGYLWIKELYSGIF